MSDGPVVSSFVSQVTEVGFADASEGIEHLQGQTVVSGRARLEIGERVGDGLAGGSSYAGVLHTGSGLTRTVPVDIVVTPWSPGWTEIGLRPLGRIGGIESGRARRFYGAADAALSELVDRLVSSAAAPVTHEASVTAGVPAAA